MPLIHQIVLGHGIPPLNQECLDSWRQLADRAIDVVSWTDQRINDYLTTSAGADLQRLYARARNYGEASDILRMAITHTYGGFYVDWDVLLVDTNGFVALMGDFENSDCVLVQDRYTTEPGISCAYDNSLFYMRRGHPLALEFLHEMERNFAKLPIPDTPFVTGPLALTHFLETHPHHKDSCRMIDTLDLYEFDYADVIRQTSETQREALKLRTGSHRAPAIHFWTHCWTPKRKWSQRLRDRLRRAVRSPEQ
jgi:Glycosyltransferase sugar-binding region containing DXD motif